MRSENTAFAILAVVIMAVSCSVAWSMTLDDETPSLQIGDLEIVGSLAKNGLSADVSEGAATLSFSGDDVVWKLSDLTGPAYIETDDSGVYHSRFSDEAVLVVEGSSLMLPGPGKYRVVLEADGVYRIGTVTLDGSIEKVFQWTRTDSRLINHSYEVRFSYRMSDVLAYQDDDHAVRHYQSGLPSSRFAVVDDDIQRLEALLKAEYLSEGKSQSVGEQDYADYLLSFVQCCVDYPDMVSIGADGVCREDNEDGSPDTYLYGTAEYWAYPMETLHRGSGDCEDTSFLAAALFTAAGYPAGVLLLSDHMVAAVGLTLFEPRIVPLSLRQAAVQNEDDTMRLCETTTSHALFVGYLDRDTADEAESEGMLSMVDARLVA